MTDAQPQTTYLELSDPEGGSHKFYEVAVEWLEKAYEKRDNALIHLKVDPEWDDLRDDPRFNDLLKRMRLL